MRVVRRHVNTTQSPRSGATLVELAVVLPVFAIFLAGLMEVNHAYMVRTALKGAVNKAARYAVADGVTTAQVEQRVEDILNEIFDASKVTIMVRDASLFDSGSVDAGNIDYSALPAITLSDAEPRQLFIVRAEVDYTDVALLPPFFVKITDSETGEESSIHITAQAVMRHE